MRRILAIVEGHAEEHFIRSTYANSLVLRPFSNGKDVTSKVIAEKIAIKLKTYSSAFDETIILLDLEKRRMSTDEFRQELEQELSCKCNGRRFIIGIADIQIENWILADEQIIANEFGTTYSYTGDGTPAKSALKKLSGVNMSFRATADLLKKCDANRISEKSPSFDTFRKMITCEWHWMKINDIAA